MSSADVAYSRSRVGANEHGKMNAPHNAAGFDLRLLTTVSLYQLLLLHQVLMARLHDDAVAMAHLDPTEIIATPYPLWPELMVFGALSAGGTLLLSGFWKSQMSFFFLIVVVVSAFALIVVYPVGVLWGASIEAHLQGHSVVASLHVSTLVLMEPLLLRDERAPRLTALPLSSVGAVLGVVMSSLLRILDHGLAIQRWPLPVVLGSTVGFVVGTSISVFTMACTRSRQLRP